MYTDINNVNIYLLDITSLSFDCSYINLLEDRRKNDIIASKNEDFKIRSLYTGLLLRYALSVSGGHIKTPLEMEYNRYGKPRISGEKVYFNISHSENLIAVAVSENDVGLDIEKISDKNYGKVAERILSESELKEYRNNVNPNDYFISCWVKKESYLKYVGTGVNRKLSNLETKDLKCCQHFVFYESNKNKFAVATTAGVPHVCNIIRLKSLKVV